MLFQLGAKRINDMAADAGIVNKQEEKKSVDPGNAPPLAPVSERPEEGEGSMAFEPMLDASGNLV